MRSWFLSIPTRIAKNGKISRSRGRGRRPPRHPPVFAPAPERFQGGGGAKGSKGYRAKFSPLLTLLLVKLSYISVF